MGHNILLVTDDRESKELLMLHLNSNGFTVDIAENEEMFNVCFGHQKANLILIDMMMKSLNIYELIRVIRLKSNLPIILIADKENDANRILLPFFYYVLCHISYLFILCMYIQVM